MKNTAVKQAIEVHVDNSQATVLSDDGRHFDISVVSNAFSGLSSVKRQQLVYAALNQYITSGDIHAVSIKTSCE